MMPARPGGISRFDPPATPALRPGTACHVSGLGRVEIVLGAGRDVVALVDGAGEIVVGRGRNTPQGPRLGSTTVSAALRAARESEHGGNDHETAHACSP